MTWEAQRDAAALFEAIRTFDRPEAARLCGQLIAHVHGVDAAYPELEATDILTALRRKRHFELMGRVADAFIQTGLDRPVLRRQYAQALIDQGMVTAAIAVLEPLAATTVDADPREHREAIGLLGRSYKQLYVATGPAATERRHRSMSRAVASYREVFDDTGSLWHGINVVAMLARAERDDVAVDGVPRPGVRATDLARGLATMVEQLGADATAWDRATAMEASIALALAPDASPADASAHADRAVAWLGSYLRVVEADAFELASTLRQLTEVWQLSADQELGSRLVPVLQAELLRRQGGEVEVGHADIERRGDTEGLEKVLGTERFNSLRWFRDALERCRGVARIEDPYDGGVGTGFLVDGGRLHPSLPEVVLVTNAHVLGDAVRGDKDPEALDVADALVTFRALDDGAQTVARVDEVVWTSPRGELDATIATMTDVPTGVVTCPIARRRPLLETDSPTQTYIIGHPGGDEQPMFSIRDNLLLDANDTRVHYRTPTLGGSSGSPVFNTRWEVIALHHAGKTKMPRLTGTGTHPANEGIWFDRITAELQSSLGQVS